jgi:outer membrane protein
VKKVRYLALLTGVLCASALAQSAGSFIVTGGAACIDYGPSSATPLQSASAAGIFTSSGTSGQIHNIWTVETAFTYFITDNIAVDLTTGVPPKLELHPQGYGDAVRPRLPRTGQSATDRDGKTVAADSLLQVLLWRGAGETLSLHRCGFQLHVVYGDPALVAKLLKKWRKPPPANQ